MKSIGIATSIVALLAGFACDHVDAVDAPSAEGDGQGSQSQADGEPSPSVVPLEAMDIVMVVDNSGSMAEEQAIFATSVIHLVNTLTTPRSDWPYPAVDDLRIAVVSSDMGVSVDGAVPNGDDIPPSLQMYANAGDDGAFEGTSVNGVTIEDGVVPCQGVAGQCPPGWTCAADDDGVGAFCRAPEGDTTVACPDIEDAWAETTMDDANPSLGLEVACLSSLGTAGCGWEQQLGAAARAASREDQAAFFRENAGLGVLVVSDEDDCSLSDAAGMFASEEAVDASKLNIACGENPEFLHSADHFKDAFAAAKGGDASAVFFAAIVGVPADDACQGSGTSIGACLESGAMQSSIYIDEQSGMGVWKYEPSCTRSEGDQIVTSAAPGRRFVELAEAMGDNGYVFSICNENWIPAMDAFAAMMASAVDEN